MVVMASPLFRALLCVAAALIASRAVSALDETSWSSLRPADPLHRHAIDEIISIPGYLGDGLPSRQFGGYITVDQDRGRHLYYYFVTSERSPESDPVVLWLNGGPGCSSFDGFVYEHGPFLFGFKGGKDEEGRVRQELELTANPHSWSKVANMLYVDSPAGVGMSYSETHEDYHTNDTHTAADLNRFLRRWFEKYSEFQANDLYISGESYAGVYVPMASQAVLDGNDAGQEPKLNLKGYLVGNGVTDPEFDGNALVPFAFGKSLIPAELHHRAHRECGGGAGYWNATLGSECHRLLNTVWGEVSGLNIYGILESCYHGHNPYKQPPGPSEAHRQLEGVQQGEEAPSREAVVEALQSVRRWPLLGGAKPGPVPGLPGLGLGHTPPCLDSREMWAFCNSPEVREAIHAQPIHRIGRFDECTNGDRIHYLKDQGSVLDVHRDLLDRGLDALIYSGDHDMAVPHTGSEAWTSSLGLETLERWRSWHTDERQVAGYAVHYRGLVYATVKGAGHMVPEDKPAEALTMFDRFLHRRRL